MLFDKAAPKSTAASSTLMMIPLNIQKTVEFSITTPELFPTSFIDSFMNRFFFPDTWVTNWENRTEIMLKFSHKGSFVRVTGACAQRGFSISPAAAPQRCSVSGWNLIRGLMWPFHGVKVFLCTLLCAPSTACTCEPILNTKLNLAAFKPWMIHANDCISKWFVFKWHLNLNVYFLMSHMTSHFLRPRQTEVGLLLHRHLLPQQHLRVRVLLLPSRVTLHSLSILPAKDQGNKVVLFFFLAPSSRTKASFDCFLCAIQPPVNHFLPSEKELSWRRAVTVIAKSPSSLSSCIIPSLVARFRD